MLAFMHAPSSSPIAYLPAQPSPLSPRSANISSRWGPSRGGVIDGVVNSPGSGNSYMSNPNTITAHDENATPLSKRSIKRVPLQRQEDLKERRRTNFLRNVRDRREERRYEARGEDVMRLEFVQKKRAWERELERGAPVDAPVDAPEEDELPMWSQGGSQMQMSSMRASSQALPEEEVEDFVRDEEGELEALLEFMPEDNMREAEQGMEVEDEEELWSDGADYDALFSEMLGLEENTQNQSAIATAEANAQHVQQQQHGEDDEMDMS